MWARVSFEFDRAVLVAVGLGASACQLVGGFEDHKLAEADVATGGSGATAAGGEGAGAEGGGGDTGGVLIGGAGATGTGGTPVASECGNGVVEASSGANNETCDDGENVSGDGCSADCLIECGDSFEFLDTETGHCYKYDPDFMKTWYDAVGKCEAWFGTLAVVTDVAERDSLLSAFGHTTAAWLGASYSEADAQYVWATGEPFVYAPWESGAPAVDGCVVFQPVGEWYTYDCNYQGKPFFCERATGLP